MALDSAVCEGGNFAQAKQSLVGGNQSKPKHFRGSGKKTVGSIRMQRQKVRRQNYFEGQRGLAKTSGNAGLPNPKISLNTDSAFSLQQQGFPQIDR